MSSQLRKSGSSLTHTASSTSWSGPTLIHGMLALTVWSSLLAGAALLVVRRLAEAFDSPLSIAGLAITGFLLALFAHTARVILPDEFWRTRRRGSRQVAAQAAGLCVAALGAIAVSLPTSSPLGLMLLWTPLLFEGIATFRALTRRGSGTTKLTQAKMLARISRTSLLRRETRVARHQPARGATRSNVQELQSLVRIDSAGGDAWRGRVLVRLARGRRAASAHVAFCPPFAETPTIRIKARPRAGMEVAVGQVLPHGVRFDVKLSANAARTLAVPIEFHASGQGIEPS